MIGRYRKIKMIGHGTYGKVYLVQDGNAFLAVKAFKKYGSDEQL